MMFYVRFKQEIHGNGGRPRVVDKVIVEADRPREAIEQMDRWAEMFPKGTSFAAGMHSFPTKEEAEQAQMNIA